MPMFVPSFAIAVMTPSTLSTDPNVYPVSVVSTVVVFPVVPEVVSMLRMLSPSITYPVVDQSDVVELECVPPDRSSCVPVLLPFCSSELMTSPSDSNSVIDQSASR